VKVLDVNEFYAERGGGVRTYVHAKLEAAERLGHQLVVVAPGPTDSETQKSGGKIVWVQGPHMPFDPRYFVLYREARVRAIIEKEAPDVIEGSSPWTAGWFAARYPGAAKRAFIYHQDPVAVYPHTFLDRYVSPEQIDRWCGAYWAYVRRLANRFDCTVVAGEWLANRLRNFGISEVKAVPFGIDRSLFSPDLSNAEVRADLLRRCGVSPKAALLVAISRHHPEKRLGTLLRAVDSLQARREVGLVVFGDGPLRARYDALATRCRGVHLAGFVADRRWIARSLASADAFLHGSAAETFGFVVAEALCSGTPVVVPNRGGAFEMSEPGFAETYTPGDVAECARAIERILDRDRDALRVACGTFAAQKVITQTQHFEKLFSLYAGMLGGPPQVVSSPT
jgi:alpha-1,6-mannosyltransferase